MDDTGYDQPEIGEAAETAALAVQNKLSESAQPIRTYLDSSIVPLLMQGLQAVVKERPHDPIEYLAAYLLKNRTPKDH
ncbi:hypothetical protein RI054_12g63510 [Pseudoscourfieldia marina]